MFIFLLHSLYIHHKQDCPVPIHLYKLLHDELFQPVLPQNSNCRIHLQIRPSYVFQLQLLLLHPVQNPVHIHNKKHVFHKLVHPKLAGLQLCHNDQLHHGAANDDQLLEWILYRNHHKSMYMFLFLCYCTLAVLLLMQNNYAYAVVSLPVHHYLA